MSHDSTFTFSTPRMKVTDYVAHFLAERGVTAVFELSGGMITHLLDSVARHGKTRIVSTHHEQAAGFAADGYGRMTGIPGVALATSGPGATNLLTAIGSCYFDSTPAVFITGQVNRHEQKGQREIRQLGFQETDIVSMAGPVTKQARQILQEEELPAALAAAFQLATSGRPGPVLLDLPMDIQRAEIAVPQTTVPHSPPRPKIPGSHEFSQQLRTALAAASRPLVLVGGGVRAARCQELLERLVTQLGVPVVHSLMAVDVLPHGHALRVGMIGTYGNRWANLALQQADVVLVIGSRLDVRQTGSDTAAFSRGKTIFQVDCERGEMNNRVSGCVTLEATLPDYLSQTPESLVAVQCDKWRRKIEELRERWPDDAEHTGVSGIHPNRLMHQLSEVAQGASAFVVDVGQHQMWAAQSLRLRTSQRFLTSGGMGAMGFALPAAIGVVQSLPDHPCVVIAGDGGFQVNIQELETIRRNSWPIRMLVVNNNCHGMVRQFQESYFERRYQSTLVGYSAPGFSRIAEAYGIPGRRCSSPEELSACLRWLMDQPPGPRLLEVVIDTFLNAYPKVAFGCPLSEMEPLSSPVDMEST